MKILPDLQTSKEVSLLASSVLLKSFKGENLAALRFSQRTIQASFANEKAYLFENPYQENKNLTQFDILRQQGWSKKSCDKIDVVLMPDGLYTSMDNRRLAVAKAINEISHSIEVPVRSHYHYEKASSLFLSRVSVTTLPNPPQEIIKSTYGHAITSRIQLSSVNGLRESEIYGFDYYPAVVTGLKGKGLKSINVSPNEQTVTLKKV